MVEELCIHTSSPETCAYCVATTSMGSAREAYRTGHEKHLIYCPVLSASSLLHYNKQGDSYRVRAFLNDPPREVNLTPRDANTSDSFERLYKPQFVVDVSDGGALTETSRWVKVIAEANYAHRELFA